MLLGSGAGDGFDGKANATAGAAKSRTTRAILRDFIMGFSFVFWRGSAFLRGSAQDEPRPIIDPWERGKLGEVRNRWDTKGSRGGYHLSRAAPMSALPWRKINKLNRNPVSRDALPPRIEMYKKNFHESGFGPPGSAANKNQPRTETPENETTASPGTG